MAKKKGDEGARSIVIVGAGPSGITYANKMLELGYKVIVLESENQVGGRTRSIYFGGTEHPAGAAFNHFKGLHTSLKEPDGKSYDLSEGGISFIGLNGQDFTADVVESMETDEMPESPDAEDYANKYYNYMHYGSAAEEHHDAVDTAALERQSGYIDGVRFSEPEEEVVSVGPGWAKAVRESAEALGDRVITNARVSKIQDHGEGRGATVTYSHEGEEATIKVDHVHVAIPAPAVKHIKIEGEARRVLPAIESVVSGKATRVFLEYPVGTIEGSDLADDVYRIIDTEEFGLIAVENHSKFDPSSSTLRVMLLGDGAERADEIIDEKGNERLEKKISSLLAEKLGFPKAVSSRSFSWQKVKSAEGSWPLHVNPIARMQTAEVPGSVSFGGDYQPFECHHTEAAKYECTDRVGTVHGAAISGENQARRTHEKLSGLSQSREKQGSASFFIPGAEAASPWGEEYINSLLEYSRGSGRDDSKGRDENASRKKSHKSNYSALHPNMCNVIVPSLFFMLSVFIAHRLSSSSKFRTPTAPDFKGSLDSFTSEGKDMPLGEYADAIDELKSAEKASTIKKLQAAEKTALSEEKRKLQKALRKSLKKKKASRVSSGKKSPRSRRVHGVGGGKSRGTSWHR